MAEEALNFERPEDMARVGRHWWRLEVSAEKIKEVIAPLREQVEKLKGLLMAQPERGPVDYPAQDDDIRRLASIIERIAQRPPDNSYREAPRGSPSAVMIGCTITLLCAFVIGAVVFSNEFSAFKAQVLEWQKSTDRRLEVLERRP